MVKKANTKTFTGNYILNPQWDPTQQNCYLGGISANSWQMCRTVWLRFLRWLPRVQLLGKTIWQLNIRTLYDQKNLLLAIYSREMKTFGRVNSTTTWRIRLWAVYTVDFCLAVRSTPLTHATQIKRKITTLRTAALRIKPNLRAADSLRIALPQPRLVSEL